MPHSITRILKHTLLTMPTEMLEDRLVLGATGPAESTFDTQRDNRPQNRRICGQVLDQRNLERHSVEQRQRESGWSQTPVRFFTSYQRFEDRF